MNHHSSTPPDRYWSPGDHILIRHRRRGRVRHAWPVTVVHDGFDYSALYLLPGTPVKRPVLPDGSPVPRDMPYAEAARVPHQIGDDAWRWNHLLEIVQEGDAYGIALFW